MAKGLIRLGISLALISSISMYSPSQQNSEDLERKTINYSINDSINSPKTDLESNYIISKRSEFVDNAKKYLGKKWEWGGRNNPHIDCMGLIFLPYAKTFNKKWTDLSVNPGEIIKEKQLGESVKGLDGVLKENIDYSKLKKGDIIYFLSREEIEDDIPSAKINGISYWTRHMGIYSNEKKNLLLNSNAWKGKVMEENLKKFLEDPDLNWEGIYVTRIHQPN